jgi:hypothetical protein
MTLTSPLNTPLEVGLRVVFILATAYPTAYDVESLAYFDHSLLYSGQREGPPSLHPELPGSVGELAIKRDLIKSGIDAMMRARLVSAQPTLEGFKFRATEDAISFTSLLYSPYARRLHDRAAWVNENSARVGIGSAPGVRAVLGRWIQQFERVNGEDSGNG